MKITNLNEQSAPILTYRVLYKGPNFDNDDTDISVIIYKSEPISIDAAADKIKAAIDNDIYARNKIQNVIIDIYHKNSCLGEAFFDSNNNIQYGGYNVRAKEKLKSVLEYFLNRDFAPIDDEPKHSKFDITKFKKK